MQSTAAYTTSTGTLDSRCCNSPRDLFQATSLKPSPRASQLPPVQSSKARTACLDRVGSAVDRLFTLLGATLDGPEADLVLLSFEGQDAACVW